MEMPKVVAVDFTMAATHVGDMLRYLDELAGGQKTGDGGPKAAGKAMEEQILRAASSMPAKEWKKEKARLLALLKKT